MGWLRHLISFFILFFYKAIGWFFYRFEWEWVNPEKNPSEPWTKEIKIIAFLNHTSLWEPLLIAPMPVKFIWENSDRVVLPAAEKTMKRPLIGKFFKLIGPKVITITRKRDSTWLQFLSAIDPDSLIVILPEGRMKRPTGLDSTGKPMNVRTGIVDVIERMGEGKMLVIYSGGLHHVQVPGQFIPKPFKTIRERLELIDLKEYKEKHGTKDPQIIANDLQERMKLYCPS